jgi:hypothetical protein
VSDFEVLITWRMGGDQGAEDSETIILGFAPFVGLHIELARSGEDGIHWVTVKIKGVAWTTRTRRFEVLAFGLPECDMCGGGGKTGCPSVDMCGCGDNHPCLCEYRKEPEPDKF